MSMPSDVQTGSHSLSGHHPLRIASWIIGILALAGAVTVVVLPLPKPAAGGTCGPGRGSEAAIEAFFDPVSIGAGPRPSSPAIAVYEWQAFVGQCQASTNARMVDALALLVVAGFLLLVASPLVGRTWRGRSAGAGTSPAAGWYPDPSGSAPWRWWDGRQWSVQTRPDQQEPVTSTAPAPPTAAPQPPPAPPGRSPFSAEPTVTAPEEQAAAAAETAPPERPSEPG
jgi:hypothetical protein